MDKKFVGAAFVTASFLLVGCTTQPGSVGTDPAPSAVQPAAPAGEVQGASTDETMGDVKEFTVNGSNFAFAPSTITVKKGDRVRITFKDDDGFHDLRIDGYDVGTSRVQTGQESVVEFTADKAGSFAYYCSVGQHRANGMKGTLIIE